MSNHRSATATAQILRILYDSSAFSDGRFRFDWRERSKLLVPELAHFTDENNKPMFVSFLNEAKEYCKFSQNAWELVKHRSDKAYLRKNTELTHAEHVVPVSLVQKIACNMFEDNCSDQQIADMLLQLVEVVFITKEEQKYLDGEMGFKNSMPHGWDANIVNYDFSQANIYARLVVAGIQFAENTIGNSIRGFS